jgi:NAD+ synthase
MTYKELEKAMNDPHDKNHKKYLEIRKKNLHKMDPIPVCTFKVHTGHCESKIVDNGVDL